MEDDGIKWCRMGTGRLVEPTPSNLVVPLLAHYGVSPSRIVGYEYKGVEFQDLDANKYKDYTVAFFGTSPDEELPTREVDLSSNANQRAGAHPSSQDGKTPALRSRLRRVQKVA